MKKVGIITIHRIYNYGSVLQAFALQKVCEVMGYYTEIIDYIFPNEYHKTKSKKSDYKIKQVSIKSKILKYLYIIQLFEQHRNIKSFIKKRLHLSSNVYISSDDLKEHCQKYDIYITGSDQLWNPRYTYGDTSFFLDFAPDDSRKIAYAASFGSNQIDNRYNEIIRKYLKCYDCLSVRESSGMKIIKSFIQKEVEVVLDPTLLLDASEWSKYAVKPKKKEKYILCYFLNYTFDPFPYIDNLAAHISEITGYHIVRIARPPLKFVNRKTQFVVNASPEEFLGWIQNAELVLTTSFHGTAFAVNFSVPVFSVIESKSSLDSRQLDFLKDIGLENRILTVDDNFPKRGMLSCDYKFAQSRLRAMRVSSLNYLKNALSDE